MHPTTAACPCLVLKLVGTFDVPAAWRARDAIVALPDHSKALLDFSGVREVHDFALGALFTALADGRQGQVETRGLSRHHYTLLRYLGRTQESTLPLQAEGAGTMDSL